MLSCILALNQMSQWFVAVDIDDYSCKIAFMNYLFAELVRMIQIHIYKSEWSRIEAWVSLAPHDHEHSRLYDHIVQSANLIISYIYMYSDNDIH